MLKDKNNKGPEAGLEKLSDGDLDTLKTGKEDSEGSGNKTGHPDDENGNRNDESEKLAKRLADQESYYQRREREMNERVSGLQEKLNSMTEKFNTIQSDEKSTKVQEIDQKIAEVKKTLRDGDVSEATRTELEDQLVELKLDRRDAAREIQEQSMQRGEETLKSEAKNLATRWIADIIAAENEGENISEADLQGYKDYAREKKLPSWINAFFHKKIESVSSERDDFKRKFEDLTKQHETLVENINKIKKARGLLREEEVQLEDKSKRGSSSSSNRSETRVRRNLTQGAKDLISSDPELAAAIQETLPD